MLLFPKDFPEKLRESILVSEVVGKKVKLKLRGKEFHGLCPFHNEKTPSFTVNDSKGFYHCFGCGAHGDAISFVMNSEGLSYPETVVKLATDFSIQIPKVSFDPVKEDKLARDFLVLEKIGQFFEKNLYSTSGNEARNYLKKRGLNSTIAKKFRLGFAPNSFDALHEFLKSEGFSELEISRTGVVGKNDSNKLYDKFRNRVIFPITDKKNRIIAFGGRSIGDEMPKYLNSSETDFFKKNQTLYNFANARKATFAKGYAVVVEGYMDVIALASNGIENVVAGLGTALGVEHLRELFFITDKITICLDGDSAGIKAAKRAAELALPLISAKKNLTFAFLPNQLDPDDFIKKFGAKELENLLEAAIPLSESLFEFALSEIGIDKNKKISAENKAKLEALLNSKIAAINDASSKKFFSFFFKDALFFLGRNQKSKSPQNSSAVASTQFFQPKIQNKSKANSGDLLAKNIIAFIIKFPKLAGLRDDFVCAKNTHFSNEKLTILKENVLEAVESISDELEKVSSDELLAKLDFAGFEAEIAEIKNVVASLDGTSLDFASCKFRILLLSDLLLQVEEQYKEILSRTDEIETHQSAISSQKIREIFDYKNSIQAMILALEKELT